MDRIRQGKRRVQEKKLDRINKIYKIFLFVLILLIM